MMIACMLAMLVISFCGIANAESEFIANSLLAVLREDDGTNIYLQGIDTSIYNSVDNGLSDEPDLPVKIINRIRINDNTGSYELHSASTNSIPIFTTESDTYLRYFPDAEVPAGCDHSAAQVLFLPNVLDSLNPPEEDFYAIGQRTRQAIRLPSRAQPVMHGVCNVLKLVREIDDRRYIHYYEVDEHRSDLAVSSLYSSSHDMGHVYKSINNGEVIANNHQWNLINIHRKHFDGHCYYLRIGKVAYNIEPLQSAVEQAIAFANPSSGYFRSLTPYIELSLLDLSDRHIVLRDKENQTVRYGKYPLDAGVNVAELPVMPGVTADFDYSRLIDTVWVQDQVFALLFRTQILLVDLATTETIGCSIY
jgi:hypothetical protein